MSDEGPGELGDLLRTTTLDTEDAFALLRTARAGLSPEEASARLARTGPNELPEQRGPSLPRQLLDQMVHFFALMLWAAAALAFVADLPELGVAIVLVVILNGAFSFAQEYRADRAVRALAALLPETAVVRRGGRKLTVPAAELVPGDVVLLKEGDRISADARVIRSSELKVDMSTMTGESEPLLRGSERLAEAPDDPLEADNVVFAGTFVASGSATGVVAATGSSTRLGGISTLTGQIVRRPTPLRLQLNRAVRLIAAFAILTGVVFFGAALWLGTDPKDGFLFSIGVIVALVPEGLLPTLSLSLAMSATRMANRGALVRRLESVETLGCTTVICTDKTGTITTNQMTARTIVLPEGRYGTTGTGYEPGGTIVTEAGRPLSEEGREALHGSWRPRRSAGTPASNTMRDAGAAWATRPRGAPGARAQGRDRARGRRALGAEGARVPVRVRPAADEHRAPPPVGGVRGPRQGLAGGHPAAV
jgi:magnesium-transporting ATPase (P-type)